MCGPIYPAIRWPGRPAKAKKSNNIKCLSREAFQDCGRDHVQALVCKHAGLPGNCTTHGLRKAFAFRHALNGATAPELMAWHGWKTIGQAQLHSAT